MYQCKKCGNKKYFIEHNCVETEVTLDETTGEHTGSHDTFVECAEVICGFCKATSSDGAIINRRTNEPIKEG